MGTRSLTYVYDQSNQIIIKMYLQFDGYPSGHGSDLATFLKKYHDKRRNVSMESLAGKLATKFLRSQPDYAMLISPEDHYYHCEEWTYHIYQDKVVFVGWNGVSYEADWRTEEFAQLCLQPGIGEEEELDATKQDEEKDGMTE